MSESIAATESADDSRKVSKVSEAVIRIAGNSQDGIQSIGGFLARLAGRSEQEVMTFMTIPSTISGGPSIFQVRIGSGEVLSAGDEADVLLAFYQHSYEGHINFLKEDGIVLYDSSHVEANPEWEKKYRHVGCAVTELTVEAIGGTARDKGKNIFSPKAEVINTELLESDKKILIRKKLQEWLDKKIITILKPFFDDIDETTSSETRAIVFNVYNSLGTMLINEHSNTIKNFLNTSYNKLNEKRI